MASNTYFDPTKLAAAIAAQGAGADGRTVLTGKNLLSVLTNVNAPKYYAASPFLNMGGGGDGSGSDPSIGTNPAYYQDSFGNKLDPVDGAQFGDPTGQYFANSLENPSSTGGKDQAKVTYKINADGTASPVAADNQYQPSGWVDWGRLATELAATVATAGVGGAYLGGAGAVGDGTTATAVGGGGGTVGGSTGGSALSGSVANGITGTQGLGAQIGAAAAQAAPTAGGGLLDGITAQQALGAVSAAGSVAGASGGGGSGSGGASSGGTVNNPGFWSSLAAGNYGDAASSGLSSVGNYLSTPGGVQTAAGLLGAAAGAVGAGSGLNSATTTNKIDPRVAQYVYGADGNSGLLGNVNSLMNAQLATGGLNDTQKQGLNMQLSALNDPAYASSLQQQRTTGAGLLAAPQAGNPFTSGQASLSPQANAQMQGGAMPPGFQPMATQLNPQRPGNPNMTGLLGNLRPYGN